MTSRSLRRVKLLSQFSPEELGQAWQIAELRRAEAMAEMNTWLDRVNKHCQRKFGVGVQQAMDRCENYYSK